MDFEIRRLYWYADLDWPSVTELLATERAGVMWSRVSDEVRQIADDLEPEFDTVPPDCVDTEREVRTARAQNYLIHAIHQHLVVRAAQSPHDRQVERALQQSLVQIDERRSSALDRERALRDCVRLEADQATFDPATFQFSDMDLIKLAADPALFPPEAHTSSEHMGEWEPGRVWSSLRKVTEDYRDRTGAEQYRYDARFVETSSMAREATRARAWYALLLDLDPAMTAATTGRLDDLAVAQAKEAWDEGVADAHDAWVEAEQALHVREQEMMDRDDRYWVARYKSAHRKYGWPQNYDYDPNVWARIAARFVWMGGAEDELHREDLERQREQQAEAELAAMRERERARWLVTREIVPLAPPDVAQGRRSLDARAAAVCDDCQDELSDLRRLEGELEILVETPADLQPEGADDTIDRLRRAVVRAQMKLWLCEELLCPDSAVQVVETSPAASDQTADGTTQGSYVECACSACQHICARIAETRARQDVWAREAAWMRGFSVDADPGIAGIEELRCLNAVDQVAACEIELEVLDELRERCERERCTQPQETGWRPLAKVGAGLTVALLVVGGVVVGSTVLTGDDPPDVAPAAVSPTGGLTPAAELPAADEDAGDPPGDATDVLDADGASADVDQEAQEPSPPAAQPAPPVPEARAIGARAETDLGRRDDPNSLANEAVIEQLFSQLEREARTIPGSQIISYFARLAAFDADSVSRLFSNTAYPCGAITEEYRVTCPLGAGELQGGDYLVAGMELAGPAGVGADAFQYGLALGSVDETRNYQFVPPFDGDLFRNTNTWYRLHIDADGNRYMWADGYRDNVAGYPRASSALVIERGNWVIWVVPRSELPSDLGGYRLTAFHNDGEPGTLPSPETSGADVSGIDVLEPLTPVPSDVVDFDDLSRVPTDLDTPIDRVEIVDPPDVHIAKALIGEFEQRLGDALSSDDLDAVVATVLPDLLAGPNGATCREQMQTSVALADSVTFDALPGGPDLANGFPVYGVLATINYPTGSVEWGPALTPSNSDGRLYLLLPGCMG